MLNGVRGRMLIFRLMPPFSSLFLVCFVRRFSIFWGFSFDGQGRRAAHAIGHEGSICAGASHVVVTVVGR
jgi:hypothetical protein